FRPALEVSDAQYQRLERELTTLPQPLLIGCAVLGFGTGIASVRAGPTGWGLLPNSPPWTTAYVYAAAVAINVTAAVFLVHTIRQLRVVDRIHRMATRLSLFNRAPLYAFSALTLRTALGVSLILYYYLVLAYVLHLFGWEPISPVDAAAIVLALAVAVS